MENLLKLKKLDLNTFRTIDNIKIITKSPKETINLGEKIGKAIRKFPTFIGVNGELGTGKTILIKGIARGLKIKEPITSPTFQIIKEYIINRCSLIHMDLYRIEDNRELLSFNNYLFNKKNCIIAVEWSDKFPELYPDEYINISIFFTRNRNKREIELTSKGYILSNFK